MAVGKSTVMTPAVTITYQTPVMRTPHLGLPRGFAVTPEAIHSNYPEVIESKFAVISQTALLSDPIYALNTQLCSQINGLANLTMPIKWGP